ncbi:MAG TPA: hypothetical protein VHX59_06080 [Mycobacteriales bacterium]|nr:hypothetical protein [Mycobacteriales bacterium]
MIDRPTDPQRSAPLWIGRLAAAETPVSTMAQWRARSRAGDAVDGVDIDDDGEG